MPRFYPSKRSPTISNNLAGSKKESNNKSVQRLCAIAHIQKNSCDRLHDIKPIQQAVFKLMQFLVKLQAMISAGV